MKNIQVLDCTLRDGGYCNDCKFEFHNIKKIVSGLISANIDIIECGFFNQTVDYHQDFTRFSAIEQFVDVIPKNRDGKLFVALADYGKFDPAQLPQCDGTSVDGLRVAFHKKDASKGIEACKLVKEKGYKVFVQAMVSVSYSDAEFLELISRVNDIEPYAFYIVDSFGMMKQKDLSRLFYMVEHNLKKEIKIGFHSHNNMQLAYSNAQSLVHIQTDRGLILDSSVYGMGRGAGNLNTELFVEYLNENADGQYDLKPLLNIIDEILNDFYQRNSWGYSLPNYLSAKHNAHPNYASYLDDKKTLTVKAMDEIFDIMDVEKRLTYDKSYIDEIYLKYMAREQVQEMRKADLLKKLSGKQVLLIAPGKSSVDECEKFLQLAKKEEVVAISINFDYTKVDTDFIFVSNLRRFRELDTVKRKKCIVTSNIQADNIYLQTQYKDLLTDIEAVRDNAGLMAIKFLMTYGVKTVYLAGFDGYAHDPKENYGDNQMALITRNAVLDAMNEGMVSVLKKYSDNIIIEFVTTPKYVVL